MITDIKHVGLFRVDFLRIVLDLDHKAIAEYTLEHKKKWDRYTTYHDIKLNEDWMSGLPGREDFENDIYEAAEQFTKRTNRRDMDESMGGKFMKYWCSVNNEHDQHGSHNHPNSLIAGTYYPQTSAESSVISLEAPWSSHIMHDRFTKNTSTFDYKPNAGDMIMWPSWLNHRVSPQPATDIPRIAISFNLDYGRFHD